MSSSYELPRTGEPFDRYEVLCHVAFGGMAAVYGVRRSSIGGFDKLLAMKVLLPHLADRRDAVEMFLDEGRIAAQIDHPNVLDVFDVSEVDGMPYMIMEYVRGQSLSSILKRLGEGASFPLELLAMILQKTAEGLHAAHETRDLAGESLSIVHRDVSPQNIMVSYEGDVKVVDFGIAAGRGRIASTRTGELKGKLSYVAPEAISRSRPLDRRADIWALGVVAWEALANQRLFADDDDASTLWNVMHGEIARLSSLRDDLPPALVRCVHACLDRDVDGRPASCAEVARELEAAAGAAGSADRERLAREMQRLFAEDRETERARLRAVMDGDGDPEAGTLPDSLAAAKTTEATDVTAATTTEAPSGGRRWWSVAVAALVAGVGVVALSARSTPPGAEEAPSLGATPSTARGEAQPSSALPPRPPASTSASGDALASASATSTASASASLPAHRPPVAPPRPITPPPPQPRFDNPY